MSGLGPHPRLAWLWRVLRPLREAAASFALVNEERDKRVAQTDPWPGGRQTLNYGATLLERVDLVVQELWRRSEAADARNATEIQRLADLVTMVQSENAAILRHLEPPSPDAAVAMPRADTQALTAANGLGTGSKLTLRMLYDEVGRESGEERLSRLSKYVGYFLHHEPTIDLGCGEGDFLELLKAASVVAFGIDHAAESIEICRRRGLDVEQVDLIEYLNKLEPVSVGGFFSSHLVEHLPSEILPDMLWGIERALRVGGVAVIATPNPGTIATHLHNVWPDPASTRPIPAPSLSFAARSAGLVVEDIVYGSPSPDSDRLKCVAESALASANGVERALGSAFNDAIRRLNELLYGYQDYALVIRKQPVDKTRDAPPDTPPRVDVGLVPPEPGSGVSIERPPS